MATRPGKPRRPGGASKPKVPRPDTPESWTAVLLEDMRAQNRATIEAVQAVESSLRRELARVESSLSGRVDALTLAVDRNTSEIRSLKDSVTSLEAKADSQADRLSTVGKRVDKLEERIAT